MSRRGKTRRWVHGKARDVFVAQRDAQGYRSRAAFKLLEIARRDGLLKPGMWVLELGASPGGWSQVARQIVGPAGRVVAVDLLPMEPLAGVEFIQGDCRDPAIIERLRDLLGGRRVDLVMSDMAPNLTGIRSVDEAQSVSLAEVALAAADDFLRAEGTLLLKMFQYQDAAHFVAGLRQRFARVARRKPAASRAASAEFYVSASGFKL